MTKISLSDKLISDRVSNGSCSDNGVNGSDQSSGGSDKKFNNGSNRQTDLDASENSKEFRKTLFPPQSKDRRFEKYFFLPPLLLFLGLFSSVIFQKEQFCTRDTANFYYPLFRQIQNEWDAGRFPGWDPYENLGQPLAANPTSSVFYPVKMIFFLPKWTAGFFTYDFCFKWYILIHYFISFAGMYLLLRCLYQIRSESCAARCDNRLISSNDRKGTDRLPDSSASRFKISRGAAVFAALAYTFSGPVFFQYCNIIFLIGAAWLPWGVLAGLTLLIRRDFRSIVFLAAVLALCVLGGEPQTVYLLGLILVYLAFCIRTVPAQKTESVPLSASVKFESFEKTNSTNESDHFSKGDCPVSPDHQEKARPFGRSCGLLFLAAVLAFLLAAIQLIPGREMAKECERFSDSAPHSVWGLFRFPADKNFNTVENSNTDSTVFDNLLCRNVRGSGHQGSIYHFSLSPWRLLELVWPNVGGDYTNRSDRWFALFPNDEELWTPTVYAGFLTLLLGLFGIKFRRGSFIKKRSLKTKIEMRNVSKKKRSKRSADDKLAFEQDLARQRSLENETRKQIVSDQDELNCQPMDTDRWNLENRFAETEETFKRNEPFRLWTGHLFIVFLLASFGGFGIGWLIRFFAMLTGHQEMLEIGPGDPLGGVYWLMNSLLPGFSMFRYPAKMMTPAVFFLAFAAGLAFDWVIVRIELFFDKNGKNKTEKLRARNVFVSENFLNSEVDRNVGKKVFPDRNSLRTPLISFKNKLQNLRPIKLCMVSYIIFLLISFFGFVLSFYFFRMLGICGTGFFQAIFVSALFGTVIVWTSEKKFVPLLILIILAGDLYWANARYVHSISENFYHRIPVTADSIEKDLAQSKKTLSPMIKTRVYRMLDWNPCSLVSDPKRIQKGAAWDQKTLAPKYGYTLGFCAANAQGTMINANYNKKIQKLEKMLRDNPQNSAVPELFRTLGTDYFFLPYRTFQDQEFQMAQTELLEEKTPKLYSFVSEPKEFLKGLDQDWPANCRLWKLDNPRSRIRLLREIQKDEKIEIKSYRPDRIAFEIELVDPSSVEIAEQYWQGWQANVRDEKGSVKAIPIEREKEIFRKISLPAGKFQVEMYYSPDSFKWGLAVSVFTCLILLLTGLVFPRKHSLETGEKQAIPKACCPESSQD